MPIERLGLQFRSIASAFFRVCGTSRCSMTSFCRKYSSGSHRNFMVLSFLKTPRSLQARPANHGIGPVSRAVFHFDPKLFGGHSRHGPGKSGQTDFSPWCYRLFSGLFLREL
jgi:hypothetical protein